MHLSLLGLWLLSLPLFASGAVDLSNDREGASFYTSKSNQRAMERAVRKLSENEILNAFEETENDLRPNSLCSFRINESLNNKLKALSSNFDEFSGALFYLRSQNKFDDIVLKILLSAHETTSTKVPIKRADEKFRYPPRKIILAALPSISVFSTKYQKDTCFDDAYRNLLNDISKIEGVRPSYTQGLFLKALEDKKISRDVYVKLEQARLNNLEASSSKLKDYYKKLSSLRIQYPVRGEKSSFVTQQVDEMNMSHRQRLFESYTDLQIMIMGNVIKKLRARLESPKVEILIYDRAKVSETITLEPMERFRLAIKLLRKEMSYLALNTIFDGRTPSYMDLMVASYEIGIIPASEIEELTSIQDIWNPQKTFWEKAKVWVQTLSTVATIAIPPPYGFIPALGIVIIEATTEKSKNGNENDPTSLF